MSILTKLKSLFLESTQLIEMANLTPKRTGFSRYIWVGAPDKRHGHRIKVVNEPGRIDPSDSTIITISNNPQVTTRNCKIPSKELNAIKAWIIRNKDILIAHARMEIDDDELKSRLI